MTVIGRRFLLRNRPIGPRGCFVFGTLLSAMAGCSGKATTTVGKEPLRGVQLRIAVESSSPLVEAVRVQAGEWSARTGAQAVVVESDSRDTDAQVRVVSGRTLGNDAQFPAIPRAALADSAANVTRNASAYRSAFTVRGSKTVAVPIAGDLVLLWYRSDLFADSQLAKRYLERSGKPLAPPQTWLDYVTIAEFLQQSGAVQFGCAEAMDDSSDALRNYFVHCAAYAKGPNWSGFVFDTETGAVLLRTEPYLRGLVEWIEARRWSPAAAKGALSAEQARQVFRSGHAAMLLDRIPPTVGAGAEMKSELADAIAVAPLPGAETVFDQTKKSWTACSPPNRCVHFATTGWYVTLGRENAGAAAEALVASLVGSDDCAYLVQAARRGVLPVHAALLSEPARFHSYGLSAPTTTQLFAVAREALRSENWVADLRFAQAAPWLDALASSLCQALSGGRKPDDALEAAARQWETILGDRRGEILDSYRASLGLPRLRP